MEIIENSNKLMECIHSDSNVFIQGGDATPHDLISALIAQSKRVKNITLFHLHTHGGAEYAGHKYTGIFNVVNLFVGGNLRREIDYDRVDYLPCFLSEIPALFTSKTVLLDVALIHVSPPDQHGYCTLGTSVDATGAAVTSAKIVIAQINKHMPKVHGDGFIHVDEIDFAIEINKPLDEHHPLELTPEELKIGEIAASIIEDGSTLQMGIGAIPDSVLHSLRGHKHLGIHSEMWTDGALKLLKCGAVDNSLKNVHRGKTVSSFIIGGKEVHDFINDNPAVVQFGADYVNNPRVICRNPKVCAINSAVEIDLTGQICADSVGHKIISGVGGQMDFMRGASLSEGGKPIIVMNSRSKKGFPKIVAALKPGAGVVTTRSHVHYVVTEYGIANLYGKTLKKRAQALVSIAHPEDRELLERNWRDSHSNL